ncbi:MFS general substrate transporter [Sporormia fimetaria CBS 119925]|uniref:MFS general substrate transporter n=1 Tax=Sporormia fimetaria CBS 119925 TaxID=1340428 RepID=A0A6A6UX80_9PLEO|nr:MFS general substrate transporter [Sporormia fimetaria CBS 119925]
MDPAMDRDLHRPSRASAVLAVTAATLACCTLFVVLRLISRFAIVRKGGLDDYFMVLAWVLAFGTSFTICYGTAVGLGKHEDDIPVEWQVPMKKLAYVFSVLYNPALMATKTSILVFYLSLSRTQRVFRYATFATLTVVNIGGLALTLLNVMQCRPVSAAWTTPIPAHATCTSIVTIYLSSAPLNIVTDLAILFLPMPILTSMRLPKKQKAILVCTFGFGVFVTVVDVVRVAYLQDAARQNLLALQSHRAMNGKDSRTTDDFSWTASLIFMWSAVEINVGIMCGCVPAMKPLFTRFLPTWILDHTVREKSVTNTSDSVMHPDLVHAHTVISRRKSQVEPAQPSSAHIEDEPMDMAAFLNSPDVDLQPRANRNSYASMTRTAQRTPTFFDFVDERRKKNFTLMTNRESIFPILMVTLLFFVWGFAYGLLDTLNVRFQQVAHMTASQTVGEHSAYYLGYLVGPLTFGRFVFNHWGFKACYTVGLCIYACGTLVFWPSAVLMSFPAFLVSNFITGLGLSTLEISANPFIALCGPPEYAEVRLLVSQGIQAIGSILSPLLAMKVLFKDSAGSSLIDVQWTYLGISFFTVILAIMYFYVPLPEASDRELEEATNRLPIPRNATVRLSGSSVSIKIIYLTFALAILSQFLYVGAQESISTTADDFIRATLPSLDTVNFQAIGHTAFAVSRFLAAALNLAPRVIKSRYILLAFYIAAVAFAAACMRAPKGAAAATNLVLLVFAQGPIFPLVFVQGIRGMGRRTKDASVLLTAAIGGGAVWPAVLWVVMQSRGVQKAYVVVVVITAVGVVFPVWLCGKREVREISDGVSVGLQEKKKEKEEDGSAGRGADVEKAGLGMGEDDVRDGHLELEHTDERDFGSSEATRTEANEIGAANLEFQTAPAWLSGGEGGIVDMIRQENGSAGPSRGAG